jgi:serine/threonine protein kinase
MSMEYCQNGDMFNLIKRTGKFCPQLTRYYFHQLLNGVEHIHTNGEVAHLDLKLENLLIDKDYNLKICDFGFVENLNSPIKESKGTNGYKAPEIHQLENKPAFSAERIGY